VKRSNPIRYWDRKNRSEETELVYGDKGVRFLYENPMGQFLADVFLATKFPSWIYGLYQSSGLSRHKIKGFIRDFRISMSEYEERPFASFNDFFIRRFKPGARTIVSAPRQMAAFAEARYIAYERVTSEMTFPVKGVHLTAWALLGKEASAKATSFVKSFEGGPLLIARLCPVDYHRFHFPDDGIVLDSYRVHGKLHSVNPVALRYRSEIFLTNERQVTLLETKHFGKLAYIEVGAMAVGKIVQSHARPNFLRGEEKGYFLFGASTVIVMGEPGRWLPSSDLLQQTARGRETLVRLGEALTD
jgi:phosphatidylserine decarboxylase